MLADLDLLLTAVFAAADDLLPERRANARRSVTDAEIVTLAVAQTVLNVGSDRDFLAAAGARLSHPVPEAACAAGLLEASAALHRDDRLADGDVRSRLSGSSRHDGVDRLHAGGMRAQHRHGAPLSAGSACASHYSRSHSRWFWGMRLHLLAAPDGTPRAVILASAEEKERDVALRLFVSRITRFPRV